VFDDVSDCVEEKYMVDVTLLDVDSGDTLERAIADLSEAESL
jgi:hypothetical protein